MLRLVVVLGVAFSPASSWWFSNTSKLEEEGPWHAWLRERSPTVHEYVQATEEKMDHFYQVHFMELPRLDAGLWLVIDTLVGLVGWAIFGTAWNEVRMGCRRIFQFTPRLFLVY